MADEHESCGETLGIVMRERDALRKRVKELEGEKETIWREAESSCRYWSPDVGPCYNGSSDPCPTCKIAVLARHGEKAYKEVCAKGGE